MDPISPEDAAKLSDTERRKIALAAKSTLATGKVEGQLMPGSLDALVEKFSHDHGVFKGTILAGAIVTYADAYVEKILDGRKREDPSKNSPVDNAIETLDAVSRGATYSVTKAVIRIVKERMDKELTTQLEERDIAVAEVPYPGR